MNRNKVLLSVVGVGLLALPLLATNCDPVGGNTCSGEADCTTDEHCHPTLNVCVPNCKTVTSACDSEPGTSCSESGILAEPLGGLDFNGVCVCDPANDTCPDGEKCSPYDRTCDVPCTGDTDCSVYPDSQSRTCQDASGSKFCLLPSDDCRSSTEANFGCDAAKVCDNRTASATIGTCVDKCTAGSCGTEVCNTTTGFCEATCDVDTCLSSDQLCGSANQCVAPDEVTNTCGAPGSMDTGAPILYVDDPSADVETMTEADDPADCVSTGKHLKRVTFTVDGALHASDYSHTYWWQSGGSFAATTYYTDASDDGDFLFVYMCFTSTSAQTRAFYHDNNGESNRVCVDF